MDDQNKKYMSAADAAEILSKTLKDMTERKITLRRAMAISRVAIALSKAIEAADLNDRVEFLEQTLKKRK